MMRNVNKIITVNKVITVDEVISVEKISEINIRSKEKNMNVTVEGFNYSEEILQSELFVFNQDNYDLLFSTDELFDEGKMEGSYREADLWRMVDKIRSERNMSN